MIAAKDSGMAAPCADCGTTGGYIHPRRPGHPTRERRLCSRCADWHKYHGTIEKFPLVDQRHNARPTIPTGYVDPYMLGSDRRDHAVIPGWRWEAMVADAELFAQRYLAGWRRIVPA